MPIDKSPPEGYEISQILSEIRDNYDKLPKHMKDMGIKKPIRLGETETKTVTSDPQKTE